MFACILGTAACFPSSHLVPNESRQIVLSNRRIGVSPATGDGQRDPTDVSRRIGGHEDVGDGTKHLGSL